jgi:hypothetical protein
MKCIDDYPLARILLTQLFSVLAVWTDVLSFLCLIMKVVPIFSEFMPEGNIPQSVYSLQSNSGLCSMSVERDIRFDLIARLCPNTTGAELRSVATEVCQSVSVRVFTCILSTQAGMFAIRARRKVASERDFLDAVEKVVRQGTKFSSTCVVLSFLCDLDPY